MKKYALILVFIGGLVSTQAQESISNQSMNEAHRTLILKLGMNLVDSSGERNPFAAFTDFDQMAFSDNYNVELEYRFSNSFSLSAAFSNNKWKANKGNIDGVFITSDVKYFAIDLDLKYYYDEAFGDWFDRNDWLELYLHGGVGTDFQADNAGISLNFGPGANFWISDQFGVNVNGTGKWLLSHGEKLYGSNHFQYSASLMYRFVDNDDDNDGVKNKVDDCPKVPGVAKNNGCPEEVDSDKDGVVDTIDKCPNLYGTDNGCPEPVKEVDSDGDSVLDSVDNCPEIKGLPTNNGCPLPDTDNDGVADVDDKCPEVPGIESNSGCPKIEIGSSNKVLNEIASNILFNSGKKKLKQDSYPALIKIIKMMKQYPEAQFRIEGHTDSVGGYGFNEHLSQSRANVVRDYLIANGIPSESIVIEAFGETKPTASNSTKEGRRLNRRAVVIRIK